MHRLSIYIGEIDIVEVENVINNVNIYFFWIIKAPILWDDVVIHYKFIDL